MDGKTSWRDKVLVGRLWKTVKDEEVSPKACVMVAEARAWPPASVCFSTRRQPPAPWTARSRRPPAS